MSDETPELARRELPALGLAAMLPADLAAGDAELQPAPDGDGGVEAATATFGDFLADPAAVELMRIPMAEPLATEQIEAEMTSLVTALAEAPEGGRVLVAPERFQARGQAAVHVVYELQNDVILERGVVLAPDHLVRADVVVWPAYRAAYDHLARRILESLQPLAR